MRRRWKLWAAVGVVVLATVTVVMSLREPDDGLDWIRKFGPKEIVTRKDYPRSIPRVVAVTYQFQFPGPIPKEVEEESRTFARVVSRNNSGVENQNIVALYAPTNSVYYTKAWAPNWIEVQMLKLKRKLGLGP